MPYLAEMLSPLAAHQLHSLGSDPSGSSTRHCNTMGFVFEPSGITVVQMSNDSGMMSNDSLSLKAVPWSAAPTSQTHGAETSVAFSRHDYIGIGSSSRLICPNGLTLGGKIVKTGRCCNKICNFKECSF